MSALQGIRVVEMAGLAPAPFCGMILADFGADVVRVDRIGAASFDHLARGKRSLAVNLKSSEGVDTVLRLVDGADVLLEPYRPGVMERLGLGPEVACARNPRLVYARLTGFGQDGPYADRAGYDFIIQGMSGFMSVTGERDDVPGGGPQKAGIAISDLMTGMYAAVAVLAALADRDRTGRGQRIDACLLDTSIAMMAVMNMNFLVSGVAPGRAGNAHLNIVPYQVFPCADGHLILAVGNDGQFRKFCGVAGRREWAHDARFATNAARVRNRETLVPLIDAVMRTRTQRDWLAALEAAGIPCGPINRLDQVFADPQVLARGMRVDLPHPLAGTVPQVRAPLVLSKTPLAYEAAPPLLGQHTASVLAQRLRLADGAIADLAARSIVELVPSVTQRASPQRAG